MDCIITSHSAALGSNQGRSMRILMLPCLSTAYRVDRGGLILLIKPIQFWQVTKLVMQKRTLNMRMH